MEKTSVVVFKLWFTCWLKKKMKKAFFIIFLSNKNKIKMKLWKNKKIKSQILYMLYSCCLNDWCTRCFYRIKVKRKYIKRIPPTKIFKYIIQYMILNERVCYLCDFNLIWGKNSFVYCAWTWILLYSAMLNEYENQSEHNNHNNEIIICMYE